MKLTQSIKGCIFIARKSTKDKEVPVTFIKTIFVTASKELENLYLT